MPPGSCTAGGGKLHSRARSVPRNRGGRTAITTRDTVIQCARLAQDKKAAGIRALDVRESATFTDFFLICSGTSDRQVTAVASHIEESLKKEGVRPLGIEGMRDGRWVLIDYDDFVVHVFLDSVRDFYQFDRLWGSAPEIPMPEDR
ncbi:MAG: ribosome silencing factor [Deltaproteobacteria bacterium]|nr:ribosome silencing factor [Deltaproteobacteria bacterium]MDH3384074.1 ribosome silencing factor [Deltaproteobacteria bacterium]